MEEGPTIQWPKKRGQTMIYKAKHRKLKIEQHESHENRKYLRNGKTFHERHPPCYYC